MAIFVFDIAHYLRRNDSIIMMGRSPRVSISRLWTSTDSVQRNGYTMYDRRNKSWQKEFGIWIFLIEFPSSDREIISRSRASRQHVSCHLIKDLEQGCSCTRERLFMFLGPRSFPGQHWQRGEAGSRDAWGAYPRATPFCRLLPGGGAVLNQQVNLKRCHNLYEKFTSLELACRRP